MVFRPRLNLVGAVLSLLLIVCGASGQTFLSAPVQTVIGTPTVMATADFNRDGKADVVYQDAFTGGALHVMFGNGDGTFREVQQIALPLNVGARITVADVNQDGFPDLIIGYYGDYSNGAPTEFTTLINRGDGTFGAPIYNPFPFLSAEAAFYHLAVADFDGDGHLDFIFSGTAGIFLMQGDGTGHFTPKVLAPPLSYGNEEDVYAADFNEDGKMDLAIESDFGVYYSLNKGGGNFGPVTLIAQVPTNGFGTADVNGDGHQDIIYGYNGTIYVAYGKGDGTFAAPRASGEDDTPPGYSYLALQDVDGDGRLDIVTSNSGSPVVQLQNASGRFAFSYGTQPAVGDQGLLAPVFADFDGDGIGDVVTGATGALVFSKGRYDGTFNGAPATTTGTSVLDVQPLDLNLDGLLDVAITTGYQFAGSISPYLGNGTGAFVYQGGVTTTQNTLAGQSSVADFNGDGVPDLFNNGYVLYGDGKRTFLPGIQIAVPPTNNRATGFTATADFNEDGRPDGVVSTESNNGTTVCTLAVALSSGRGTWTTSQIALPPGGGIYGNPICSGPIVTADFNGDGHQDVATASISSIYTYLGDGKGNFTSGQVIPLGYTVQSSYGPYGATDLEAADLDGDGFIDLIVPIEDQNVIQIFYGRGDGTFEPAVSLHTAQDVRFVTVADMNRDGIPDMVLGGHALVRILHGLGQRKFEATPSSWAGNPYSQKIRVADVNKDGNPDLLVPNGAGTYTEPGLSFTVLLNAAPPALPDLLIPKLACTPEPSQIGQPFKCSATFTPAANASSPAGIATFTLDGAAAGTATLSAQTALLAFPATLAPGRHAITAAFPGDANFRAATAAGTHVVSLATPTIFLSGPVHVAFGQAVPLQAALTGNFASPTGTVTFNDSAVALGQASVAAGSSAFSTSSLASGTHLLQAYYGGDTTYAAAYSNTLTVVVDPQPTSIAFQAAPATASLGATITLTAIVSAPAGPLTGTVQFLDGATQIGTSAIDTGGIAHLATTTLALGTHTLSARFLATTSLAASTSAAVQITITGIPTTTVFSTTPNPSYPGQVVTLLASVTALAPSQIPAGTVRFFDGNTPLADVPVDSRGTASLPVSNFAVGTHALQASYLGSAPLLPSQSATVQQVVLNSSFTLAVLPPQITLQTQHHTTFSLTVTSVGLFTGTVALSCGTLPAHATCRITPQALTITTAGTTQTASVYLDTSDVIGYATAAPAPLARSLDRTFAALLLLPIFTGLGLAVRHRRSSTLRRTLFLGCACLALAIGATGCSGKYPASVLPGTYTLTFTGTSSAPPIVKTVPLQLTVTP